MEGSATSSEPGPLSILRFWTKPFGPGTATTEQRRWYFNEVRWHRLKSLKRRSQRAFMSWEKFAGITARFFPSIRTGALNNEPTLYRNHREFIP
jgi:hypothetical protein